MWDKPSEGEIELFRKRGTTFQLISVVLSCVAAGEADGAQQVRLHHLIPAFKRGEVDQRTIDLVAALDVNKFLETEPMYSGYDPFSGEWSLYGSLSVFLDEKTEGSKNRPFGSNPDFLLGGRTFPPSADIGPGGQSVGQAAQFCCKVQSVDQRMRLGMRSAFEFGRLLDRQIGGLGAFEGAAMDPQRVRV